LPAAHHHGQPNLKDQRSKEISPDDPGMNRDMMRLDRLMEGNVEDSRENRELKSQCLPIHLTLGITTSAAVPVGQENLTPVESARMKETLRVGALQLAH
jgi:hypothetical protein